MATYSSLACRPVKRRQDKEIDRGIFEKVDAVRKQRDGADQAGDGKLNSEISEVQNGDEPNDLPQTMVSGYNSHAIAPYTVRDAVRSPSVTLGEICLGIAAMTIAIGAGDTPSYRPDASPWRTGGWMRKPSIPAVRHAVQVC